ncbi:hypothetical protein SAY86_024311 [Trapa natans]|uniref:RSE1/DDB1/CPSF1 C-terminal domain-containing protein n=1 Tax=Trapa natans TaxID=22666 RepID=A0AAN7RHV8_TRANT|nr:hypothetical protein SAY86_024311 [Trapa natans]
MSCIRPTLAIGTAFVQGEDVVARGHVLLIILKFQYVLHLFQVNLHDCGELLQISEVYSKYFKTAISAVASLQGLLLFSTGLKLVLHGWTGTELNTIALFDVPPLYVVSLNVVCITFSLFFPWLIIICSAFVKK